MAMSPDLARTYRKILSTTMQHHITVDTYVVKKTIADIFSKRNVSVLVIVVATVLLLSIFSYQYSSSTSNRIIDVASQEIRSTTLRSAGFSPIQHSLGSSSMHVYGSLVTKLFKTIEYV
jgi:hypothetical protein